jgi:hypothetical protein
LEVDEGITSNVVVVEFVAVVVSLFSGVIEGVTTISSWVMVEGVCVEKVSCSVELQPVTIATRLNARALNTLLQKKSHLWKTNNGLRP